MPGELRTGPDAPTPRPARADASDVALADGGRRSVVVGPDEVWGAPAATKVTPEELQREARRSFLAPIVMVTALSAALLLLFLAALLLLAWLRR